MDDLLSVHRDVTIPTTILVCVISYKSCHVSLIYNKNVYYMRISYNTQRRYRPTREMLAFLCFSIRNVY